MSISNEGFMRVNIFADILIRNLCIGYIISERNILSHVVVC